MQEKTMPCPEGIVSLISQLNRAGYEAYLVGGSLRDLLLGQLPHDFDLTTSALPEQTLSLFEKHYTVLPTGIKHGTVTVLLPTKEDHREPVEITTYRIDGTYTDARRPDFVTFTPHLRDDLARRDFTVNAMAWAPDEEIIDPFGGQKDLEKGILRAVGEPSKRFTEDALRILRGFRFAAQLNFSLHPDTLSAMAACREGLRHISAERIWSEFSRLLCSPGAPASLALMRENDIFPYILPHSAKSLRLPPQDDWKKLAPASSPAFYLAALLWNADTNDVKADLAFLKVSGETKQTVLALLDGKHCSLPEDAPAARRYLRRFGELTRPLLSLCAIDGQNTDRAGALIDRVLQEGYCQSIAQLAVGGIDLQALGVRGKNIGRLLSLLLEHVTDFPEDNERAKLLAIVDEQKVAWADTQGQ